LKIDTGRQRRVGDVAQIVGGHGTEAMAGDRVEIRLAWVSSLGMTPFLVRGTLLKKLVNDPRHVVREMLEGIAASVPAVRCWLISTSSYAPTCRHRIGAQLR